MLRKRNLAVLFGLAAAVAIGVQITPEPIRAQDRFTEDAAESTDAVEAVEEASSGTAQERQLRADYLDLQKRLSEHLTVEELRGRIKQATKDVDDSVANRELQSIVSQLKKLEQQHPETSAAVFARRALQVIANKDEYPALNPLLNREPTYAPVNSDDPLKPVEAIPLR